LVGESHPDIGVVSYTIDANGNRLSKTTAAGTDYYGVTAANKLQWVNRGSSTAPTSGQSAPYTLVTYDVNGCMTRRERRDDGGLLKTLDFVWDGDRRLRQIKEGATTRFTAAYRGDGLRVGKWDSWTGQHDYSWAPGGIVFDSSGSTVLTPGLAQRSNGTDSFFHTDWIGSTRYMTDGTGNATPSALRYDAFGERTALAGPAYPTEFQFAAKSGYQTEYADATDSGLGIDYLQQRYYDPAAGRFISPDPSGFRGGLNLYTYASNNPIGGVDPTGLDDSGQDLTYEQSLYIWKSLQDWFNSTVAPKVVYFLQSLGVLPLPEIPELGNKLDYVFGKAAGKPGDHNYDRAMANLRALEKIGIRDTPESRGVFQELFKRMLNDPDSILKVEGEKTIREAFLLGTGTNGVKIWTVWIGKKLISVIIYGGKEWK
jgi:RHS repeat-associated protein